MWIVCIFIVFYVQTLVRQNKNRFLNNNVVSPFYFPDVNLLNGRSRVFNGFAWVTRAHLLILLILPHIYTERLSEKLAWLRHDSFWDLKKNDNDTGSYFTIIAKFQYLRIFIHSVLICQHALSFFWNRHQNVFTNAHNRIITNAFLTYIY